MPSPSVSAWDADIRLRCARVGAGEVPGDAAAARFGAAVPVLEPVAILGDVGAEIGVVGDAVSVAVDRDGPLRRQARTAGERPGADRRGQAERRQRERGGTQAWTFASGAHASSRHLTRGASSFAGRAPHPPRSNAADGWPRSDPQAWLHDADDCQALPLTAIWRREGSASIPSATLDQARSRRRAVRAGEAPVAAAISRRSSPSMW